MTSILEKRRSLHRLLDSQRRHNSDLQAQLDHIQPLAGLGTITYMIAHEINNLLSPLMSYAELALANSDDRQLTEKALQKAAQNCRRVSAITESMLALANGDRQDKADVNLAELVDSVFACICRDLGKDSIEVRIDIPCDLTVRVVTIQMQHVLMNLILNARHAMTPRGGILTISARPEDESVRIEVVDTGCGLEPEHLDEIFQPFFTTRGSSDEGRAKGSGLGLAFCKRVLESHDGCISVESEPDRGARFIITLPNV